MTFPYRRDRGVARSVVHHQHFAVRVGYSAQRLEASQGVFAPVPIEHNDDNFGSIVRRHCSHWAHRGRVLYLLSRSRDGTSLHNSDPGLLPKLHCSTTMSVRITATAFAAKPLFWGAGKA